MPSFLAVIDGSIDPELILHESTFLGAAGDADRSRAGDLGELADQQLRQDDLFHCSQPRASRRFVFLEVASFLLNRCFSY